MARLTRTSRFSFRAVPRRLRALTRCKMSLDDGRDLKAENEDLRARLKRLESALKRMSSHCVNQAMEIAQQEAELKNRSERIETLVHSFDFLEGEHRNLIEEMSALEVEFDRLKAELSEKDEVSTETIKILARITAGTSGQPGRRPDNALLHLPGFYGRRLPLPPLLSRLLLQGLFRKQQPGHAEEVSGLQSPD